MFNKVSDMEAMPSIKGILEVNNNLRWILRNGEKILQMKRSLPYPIGSEELNVDPNIWIDVPFEENPIDE